MPLPPPDGAKPGADGGPAPMLMGFHEPSADERKAMQQRMFGEIDLNHDGKVSFTEFRRHHDEMVKRSFAMLDADHNGTISQAEFDKPPMPMPGGGLKRIELRTMGPGPGGPVMMSPPQPVEIFKRLDKNGDGKLSPQEFDPD